MDSSLVATRFRVPPRPYDEVTRGRLIRLLAEEALHYRLILVSAPAGYGKTTLLSQWAHECSFPVIWLSLEQEDNDFHRFFRYLLSGWGVIQPDVYNSPLELLLSGLMPDRDAVLSAFISTANEAAKPLVFILDDYHRIEDSSIIEAMTYLIDHLPANCHIVLSGRGEPQLPMARYRARGQMLELGVAELQFLDNEAESFLSRGQGTELTSDQISSLNKRLEGWVAGLQLVSLRHRHRPKTGELSITGRHRFIADYLNEDVLAELPEDLRLFLLQTSVLNDLSGPLCAELTGREVRETQLLLQKVEQEGLFLIPLDEERAWFRYHQLFADVLREQLRNQYPDQVARLHQLAARWYLANDLPDPAWQHAVEADDVALVIQIYSRYLDVKLFGGELAVIRRWIDMMPDDWTASYPELGIAEASLLLFSGAFDLVHERLNHIEQMVSPARDETDRAHIARVTAMRCFIACFQNDLPSAERYADKALSELPDEDLMFRPGIYGALGDTYRANARWKEAEESYLRLLDFSHAPGFSIQSIHFFGALADLNLRQGHLHEAARYWKRALSVVGQPEIWGRVPLSAVGWVYIRMAEVLYEWNDLRNAREYVSSGLERAELGGDSRAIVAGYLIACQLRLTEGDIPAAHSYLEMARPALEQSPVNDWVSRFDRMQLELWLAQDQLRTAVNWADSMLHENILQTRPESENAYMAVARALIVKGDWPALQRAISLLDSLLETAGSEGRTGIQIEALLLEAQAHWKSGDRVGAMTSFERSLRLAESEGYVRLFVDCGRSVLRLLQDARDRGVMPDYVATLLAAFGDEDSGASGVDAAYPEPLTRREGEILRLLAAGLTNGEIAGTLFISAETVKKHTGNIYSKLGVRGRTEAVIRAGSLNLLEDTSPR